MPKVNTSRKVVWSYDMLEKPMPLGVKCRGNCRKIHEDITKNCPDCKAYMREYGLKNKNRKSKRAAERYLSDSERIKEKSNKRYQEKKDTILEQMKEYRERRYDYTYTFGDVCKLVREQYAAHAFHHAKDVKVAGEYCNTIKFGNSGLESGRRVQDI